MGRKMGWRANAELNIGIQRHSSPMSKGEIELDACISSHAPSVAADCSVG